MIGNPARFFINGSETRSFTYEGGSTLFHWSPYESGLSTSMESNVVFFANSEDHARDVLRRLFEFWVECNETYIKTTEDRFNSAETEALRHYLTIMDQMKISPAPVNQFYEVGWADNDTLSVYEAKEQPND
jgi:hypothetical protein